MLICEYFYFTKKLHKLCLIDICIRHYSTQQKAFYWWAHCAAFRDPKIIKWTKISVLLAKTKKDFPEDFPEIHHGSFKFNFELKLYDRYLT